MNNQLNISEARANLPEILDRLESGLEHEVIITRHGKPIAKVLRYPEKQSCPLRGLPIWLSEDFDEPMTELWEALKA